MTNPPERVSVLVVDDEAPARQRLVDLLRSHPAVGGIREAGDGASAVRAIGIDAPDLVFLDFQMPELSGLEVVASVGIEAMPLTVFVTAFDQHAVSAFEANALDYLLKPFSDERFDATMNRVRTRLLDRDMRAFGQVARRMIETVGSPAGVLERIVVRARSGAHGGRVAGLDWVAAAGGYGALHLGGRARRHRATLGDLIGGLDPTCFVRIHRSAVINVDRIRRLDALSHGEFDVVLQDGSRCRVSRTYRAGLERHFGQPL